YIDTNYAPTSSVNPFSVEDGVLTITAARAPEAIRPYINNYQYTSGLLTTYESFAQTYGYFEIRADMPEKQGVWPAFWLLPADGSWPPELDVVEMVGQDPNKLILTGHSNATGTHTKVSSTAYVADTAGFHTYGVLWTEDELVWYFDDVEVARAATPADMHEPMYMLVDLAVGGMAGTPADGLATPAEMQIDYIHAYALNDWVI
ncbi:MAG: glycoside hydrolase family 16 protein, partial [Mesorhizobium sp.]